MLPPMNYRITILCENSVGPVSGTLGEHGFSALVEWGCGALLFDTGGGATLLHNSLRMHKDLRKVPAVALSHGHYDHTGGLQQFLQLVGRSKVYAHPGIFTPRYRKRDTGEAISIGIPFGEEYLRGIGAEFDLSERIREVGPSIFLTGEIPRVNQFETGDSGLYTDTCGCTTDDLLDDQSLVIAGENGLVLILGCCHAGLINTIEHARETTGISQVRAIIGGTHLGFCGDAQIDATVRLLREFDIGCIYGSHCTGFAAAARLHRELPGRFRPALVGTSIEV
jgi:7,8-dihydropterin-6-yl-methyl-4-(beta-D-ribofuranosyl)aminobenzene 5'-phosphate synthase